MKFLDRLRDDLSREESVFRAQLLREDIVRIERLRTLADASADKAAFVRDALYVGWTANDMRTHDMAPELSAFVSAFYDAARSGDDQPHLWASWEAFCARRLELLVGCLARVPKPADD